MAYVDPSFVPFDFFAFQAKYKYNILGKEDVTYSNIAKSLPEDWRADLLRERRTNMARLQESIRVSADDQNTKDRATARSTLAFAKTTVKDLELVILTADPETIAAATSNLVGEISSAITKFKAADGDNDPLKEQFYTDAQAVLTTLKWMMVKEKGILLNKNIYFNQSIYDAEVLLASAMNTIDISI